MEIEGSGNGVNESVGGRGDQIALEFDPEIGIRLEVELVEEKAIEGSVEDDNHHVDGGRLHPESR